ncbi:polynucleotidyl transferase [Striga asiatica]|uniref:poly(A)-specific ribonuclease n=1 Tax=Striga asiatica TaxID=4170 RepID=A0A5A7QRE4_STRAF|nr:polynucleotidyl transferase [Striga asiatica]
MKDKRLDSTSSSTTMNPSSRNFQIFVQSPDFQMPTRALVFQYPNPNLTLHHLKSSILPSSSIPHGSLFFTLNGKPLSDATPLLQNSPIAPLSTLTLHLRLRAGGGDGGTTGAESRDCYLNMYAVKKPDKVDPNEMRLSKWLNCSLANEPLRHPIVLDKLGNLFNKEALVEALLKKTLPKEFGYIKVPYLEFNGKYRFCAIRSCGHVLSEKGFKEVKSSSCLICHKEFSESDKIVINGTEEEVNELWEELKEEKAGVNEKKVKKIKNGDVNGDRAGRLTGFKHGVEGNGMTGDVKGSGKKFKAADVAPANATKSVYASIFTSSKKSDFKETFMCRACRVSVEALLLQLKRRVFLCLLPTLGGSHETSSSLSKVFESLITGNGCVLWEIDASMNIVPKKDEIHIREVWSDNLDREFGLIREIVDKYPYIAMDTEFPGVVIKPLGQSKNHSEANYQSVRANVEILKLIQLGLTFSDKNGTLPTCGTGKYCLWQFNFREFNRKEDVYFSDSIDLLINSGIDLEKNNEKGVDIDRFSELLMSSGIVMNDNIRWLTFHGGYDFGYLLKLLTCKKLPDTLEGFFDMLGLYFPVVYDIKHLVKDIGELHGGLSKLAKKLEVERVGSSHQAGSDSLVTCFVFFKLTKTHFGGSMEKYAAGELYDLGTESALATY